MFTLRRCSILFRGVGPSSGYVSTGSISGLTLGRVVIVEVTKKPSTSFTVIPSSRHFWLVPPFTAAAVSVAVIVFF